jgi:peptidoglycan hydrolase-like amidase
MKARQRDGDQCHAPDEPEFPVRLPRSRLARSVLTAVLTGAVLGPAGLAPLPQATADAPGAAEIYRRPASGVFSFQGHGWGHGHGMSQWGAQGAATLGKTWQQIVGFYYPHTTIAQVPASGNSIRVWISADDETDLVVLPATDLHVTDTATGATAVLPAITGVDKWRVAQTATTQQLQQHLNGTWQPYAIGGVSDFAGPVEFSRPSAGWLTLSLPGGKTARYRGTLRAARTSPSTMDTVDVLGMDDYLKGVVPYESPASWLPAALQAQAVAARTYAAYKRAHASGLTSGKFYDICDSTSCQVYAGMGGEAASTNAAVDATAGQTLLYNGQPAFTEFSSSNGGFSTDGGQPYLVAQADPWDGAAPNSEHSWTAQITAAQLEASFPAVGHLTALSVTQRDGNGDWGGRVLGVALLGVDAAGRPTSVPVTGRDIYLSRQWPTYSTGLRSNWWRVSNLDAQVVATTPAPRLVATAMPEGRGTLTTRLKVQGTESFTPASLSLVPVGVAPAFAPAPGRFVADVTHPGAKTVQPGDVIDMAVDVDTATTPPGSYAAAYRLSDGASIFGDTVSWTVPVAAPVLKGTVVAVSAPGSPPSVAGTTAVVPVAGSLRATVTVRNTGNVSWPLDGTVVLATSPAGRVSPSAGSSWLAPDRPAALTAAPGQPSPSPTGPQPRVAPGATGTVALPLSGNGTAAGGAAPTGTSTESFRLVQGTTDIQGATLNLTVKRVEPVTGIGRTAGGVSAYLDARARVTVVASGTDARAERRTLYTTGWGAAWPLGGPVLGQPTSVRTPAGLVVTVARGLDGKLWLRTSAANDWRATGAFLRDEPAAVALPDGRVQLFLRAPDGRVRTAVWSPTAGLGAWSAVGAATFASGVAATYSSVGVIVAAAAKDGSLWVDRLSGGHWTGWVVIGHGAGDAAPALTAVPGSAVVDLFARGADGALHEWTRTSSGWGLSRSIGGMPLGAPGAVALSATNVQVFARFADGKVHVRRFGAAGWLPWTVAF